MTSRKERSVHLPVEIWHQIAGHLSTTAWAKVSRTCKAMHSVQPERITISVGSESALAWVQTHWGQTSTLKLNWQQEDIPWVMAPNAASLTSLKRLELTLLGEESPNTAIVLTWLLAHAPQLQLLLVYHPTKFVVSAIHNLSHLVLQTSEFSATTAASIRQLRNLRTLLLDMEYLSSDIACADLDLASMPQLLDVCICLQDASPKNISLPRHCHLHLYREDGKMYEDTMWNGIAGHGQLRSANLQAMNFDLYLEIPPHMRGWKCSVLEWWEIYCLGEVSRPVQFDAAHFYCLTHLRLSGNEIYIQLPQELHLQVLHVDAECLSINCTNAQEQADRLQQLKVIYRTLQNNDVFTLIGMMCILGATVRKVGELKAEHDPDVDGRHGHSVSYRHEPVIWKCPCGACMNCLCHI